MIRQLWQHVNETAPIKIEYAREHEEPSPVPSDTISRICNKGIVIDVTLISGDSPAGYKRYLRDLDVPRKHPIYSILDMGPWYFTMLLVAIVASGFVANARFTSCQWPFENRCQQIVFERKTSFPDTQAADGLPLLNERGYPQPKPETSVSYSRTHNDGGILDLGLATIFGALVAFFYANFQWRMGNRQSSINEFFQRKKDINILLLSNEAVRPFLREAVDRRADVTQPRQRISAAEAARLLNEIQDRSYLGDIPRFSFDEKMFVFLEIDNLEFAIEKYISGYLDHGQMYRAIEIFQSRCYNRGFRYLALTQGLVYYKDSLKKVIGGLIIRGHNYEELSRAHALVQTPGSEG